MLTKNDFIQKIKQNVEELTLGVKTVSDINDNDELINTLGLDSLDYAIIMLQVQKWSNITISESNVKWGSIQTIEELANLFMQHIAPGSD